MTVEASRKMINNFSTYLFASPSLIGGIAQLLDFGGSLQQYNCLMGEQADYLALSSDWIVVGDDLQSAIDDCKDERPYLTESALCQAASVLFAEQEMAEV
jgi:hypothetical protein